MNRQIRLLILLGAFGLLGLVILAQYGRLMLFESADSQTTSLRLPLIERGSIYDRNGRVLALSNRLDSVSAWAPHIEDPQVLASLVAPILSLEASALENTLRGATGFVYLKRKISPAESQALRSLQSSGRLRGLTISPEYGRSYPERRLGASLLGYVGTDNVGLAGLEYTYNSVLSPPVVMSDEDPVGASVHLTLDTNLQWFLEELALEAFEIHQPKSLDLVVLEAKTAEILGYVSLPSFDPNRFSQFSAFERQNRPADVTYEPGSVFKVFSLASALEERLITPTSVFNCPGYYEKTLSSGEVVRIRCLGVHGRVTPEGILQVSCNAGAGQIGDLFTAPRFNEFLRSWGFGAPTGLPFAGESAGLLASTDRWSARTQPTIAMGQEIGVTALQMVTAATALANQGVLLKPRIVKRVIAPNGDILAESRREETRRVLRPETAQAVLSMLRNTIEGGTGRRARVEGLEIGGKTGTAQILDPRTGRYSESDFIASILTYVPALEPEFIIYIALHAPKGEFFGGRVAAPLAQSVAERLIQYYGLARTGDEVLTHSGRVALPPAEQVKVGDVMPNLIGLSKRSLIPLVQRGDLRVLVRGDGYVIRQSPPPGSPLSPGLDLILDLE